MAKAIWNGAVLAESDDVELVDETTFFPESAVNRQYLKNSSTISTSPTKGQKRYYTVHVDGQENSDAAWYYPNPKPSARKLKFRIAFWRGVEITK
jgi:uncharacterized protein (DUF427 family)